jgi:outer membrane protein
MKKTIVLMVMVLVGLTANAQSSATTMKFGFLSYDSVRQSMKEYAEMQQQVAAMRSAYEAEMKRVEDDFNKKYEEFLDGQKNFPKTILQKRQSELQEMLDKNIAFKNESQRILNETEAQLMESINLMVKICVQQVGQKHGYAFILNTDADALPWLNPEMGEDVTEEVKALLR